VRRTLRFRQVISRRAVVLGACKLSAISLLFGRLYYLQFMKADSFKTRSENNRISTHLLRPSRGVLRDRKGKILAENNRFFRLILERRSKEQTEQAMKKIGGLLDLPVKRYEELQKKLTEIPVGRSVTVKDHLPWSEVAQLEFHTPELPGVSIEEREQRYYPMKDAMAHMLGYVGAVSEKELRPDTPVLRLPEFKIGKNGVEKTKEDLLRGKPGLQQLEVNANGLTIRALQKRESVAGEDLNLTFDRDLQQYAYERLGEESGAIVVMDVVTGEVLTAVSTPAYDPNIFSRSISHEYWNSLRDNAKIPLLNKITSGQYPPGSTYKMIVALAAMEDGLATYHTKVHCPGHYFVGTHRFNCWKPEGHGLVNVSDAISESCDTYFYTMAEKLGIEKITAMSKRFGLGEVTGIGTPDEKSGLLPSAEWKRKRHNEIWLPGDTVNSSIGQGYVLSTPMQLAVMTARLANGGREVTPTLYRPEKGGDTPMPKSMGLDVKNMEIIQQAMWKVVNDEDGTARASKFPNHEIKMAGKTGTSQVKKIYKRGQDQSKIPWEDRHHALFVGYAPFNDPRYAISVVIEHGGGGSSAAAPVARDVLGKALELIDIPALGVEEEEDAFEERLELGQL